MGMTTASRQSQAIGDLYRDWLRIPGETPGWTAEDDFHQNEGWQVLTAEPGGVDYLEVDAGGRPALWAVPHGADGNAVLFAVHGGGYVGGSRFTHRKLFAHLAKAIGARALLVEYRLVHQGGAFPARSRTCSRRTAGSWVTAVTRHGPRSWATRPAAGWS